jgi:hypothetical protein
MKLMRRAVLAVVVAVLAGGACWQCRVGGAPKSEGQLGWLLAAPGEEIRIADDRATRKTEVIDRLLAGELALLEAAAWFRHLNDNPPHCPCDFRRLHRGASDGEKACRQVLEWARCAAATRHTSGVAAKILARLERELEERAATDEPIELPW